jgi:hypothetical protein
MNFHKFHALFSKRLSQARLSQVSHEMGSKNVHGCAQNAENDLGFGIFRAISQGWQSISQSYCMSSR